MSSLRAMTLTEKILYSHAIRPPRDGLRVGDIARIRVDWTIASELAWNGMDRTYSMLGRPPIHDAERFYLAIDHTVDPVTLANDPRAQRLTELSRAFAREAGIRHFYDANETILHTRFYRDLVQPGQVVLGADSHTSSHGGMGAFAIGLGGADIAVAMVLGESWIEVPEAIAVAYRGRLRFGATGKDVILKTLGQLGRNTVAFQRSVEYGGEGARDFSTDTRFAIANMTAEFGGLNGIFQADENVASWLARRDGYSSAARYYQADPGAAYVDRFTIDLDRLEPQVAKPFSPDDVRPVTEVAGMPLQGAFIGACTTTEEELVLAALVLEQALTTGTVVETRKRLVVPGDLAIEANLREAGLLAIYERGGFRVGPPGCSMCLGVASEKASAGENWLTSQNRNYENRMGAGSLAWLASGATVAASAPRLTVTDPRPLIERVDRDRFLRILGRDAEVRVPAVQITAAAPLVAKPASTGLTDAPPSIPPAVIIEARLQRFGDHIDTDAIIPGEFCHLTDLTALGERCFHYVAPGFAQRVREGQSIVVAGEGWGSGSSREQAVWALQGAGVQAVIARSFAFIHKRNLVNEALPFLVLHDDDFYREAVEGAALRVDLGTGRVHIGGHTFQAEQRSKMIRSMNEAGGIVAAIRHHGDAVFERLTG